MFYTLNKRRIRVNWKTQAVISLEFQVRLVFIIILYLRDIEISPDIWISKHKSGENRARLKRVLYELILFLLWAKVGLTAEVGTESPTE